MNKKVKSAILTVVFFLILALGLGIVTLVFYPKWKSDTEYNPASGIYHEEEDSIDVVFLGSCNIYTSFSPVLFYERSGVTSYVMGCPDETLSTSYYYLKEALKTQKPKAVVLEALFLIDEDTPDREKYNREAVDYMRPSLDKLYATKEIVDSEVEYLQSLNPSSPDKLLTFTGYLFPIVRYHNRTDLTRNDFSFFLNTDFYSYNKGSVVFYNYTSMDDFSYDEVDNGTEIRSDAKEYFPMIRDLCEEEGIELLVVKSPNSWRWDEERTQIVKNYVESEDVEFVDLYDGSFGEFPEYDYQRNTGRLNVYGIRKLTKTLGNYLVDKYSLTKTKLSDENTKKWDACVERLYNTSANEGFNINDGELAQLKCENDELYVRWNPADDCDKYEVFKSADGKDFKSVALCSGEIWYDEDVENGQMYYYYVVPREGYLEGKKSEVMKYVFVLAPENLEGDFSWDVTSVSWKDNANADKYSVESRKCWGFYYKEIAVVDGTSYDDTSMEYPNRYSYRIRAIKTVDGVDYYSDSIIVKLYSEEYVKEN